MLVYPTIVDFNFDHLVKLYLPCFSIVDTIFPFVFVSNLPRDTLRLC